MNMPTILLIDDEVKMLDLLELYLVPHGFECVKFASGKKALHYLFEQSKIDLILLDIMMPEKDGWEICREIRKEADIPVIMLTARNQTTDIVKGLNMGADDYIVKPFSESELVARIKSILRRTTTNKDEINYKGLIWNRDSHELEYNHQFIQTTPKEFELIGLLLQYPNRVFTRDDLLALIWGMSTEVEDRTIDSHVRNVRDKLKKAGFPVEEHLQTVWGLGYKWFNQD